MPENTPSPEIIVERTKQIERLLEQRSVAKHDQPGTDVFEDRINSLFKTLVAKKLEDQSYDQVAAELSAAVAAQLDPAVLWAQQMLLNTSDQTPSLFKEPRTICLELQLLNPASAIYQAESELTTRLSTISKTAVASTL